MLKEDCSLGRESADACFECKQLVFAIVAFNIAAPLRDLLCQRKAFCGNDGKGCADQRGSRNPSYASISPGAMLAG